MAKHTMNNAFRAAGAICVLILAGCQAHEATQAPLAGAAIGGRFVLTDQDGRRFDSARLAGAYPAIYFGYTYCPDVCPTDMLALSKGIAALAKTDPAKAAKVRPIFISVDPARDTPAVLRQFVAAFPPLVGLTGSQAEIVKVAKAYAVTFRPQPPAEHGSGYLVDHSRQTVLFGPDGKPIALLPTDAAAKDVAAALEQWVS